MAKNYSQTNSEKLENNVQKDQKFSHDQDTTLWVPVPYGSHLCPMGTGTRWVRRITMDGYDPMGTRTFWVSPMRNLYR